MAVHNVFSAGANLMGSDLYNHLIRYFVAHLKALRDVSGLTPDLCRSSYRLKQKSDSLQEEALLRYYASEWDRYTTGANYINRLFTYLNRHWVKRERDEGRKTVYPVYTVRFPGDPCELLAEHLLSLRLFNGKTTCLSLFNKNTLNSPVPFFASSSSNVTERPSIRV